MTRDAGGRTVRSLTATRSVVSRTVGIALLAALAACSAEPPGALPDAAPGAEPAAGPIAEPDAEPVAEPDAGQITPDGWGPLRIGMTRAELVAAAGEDANPDAVGGPDPERCDEFRPRSAPAGVLVMVRDGVLTRISVSRNADIRTPAGFRVGDRGTAVAAEYGARAVVEPHRYWTPPGRYITVWRGPGAGEDRRGVRYEIDANDEIVHIRAGGPSIEDIEGCV